MEKPDNIEEKFRKSFSDFSPVPPSQVWEKLQNDLHPEPKAEGFWDRFEAFIKPSPWLINTFTSLAAASIILILTILYFTTHDRHVIRGHAYTDESRLCGGTAILFSVEDKVLPFDTIDHYRTVTIDKNGYFQFPDVEPGHYLLRVAPPAHSEGNDNFLPSWYDQHIKPDSSHIIILDEEDFYTDVHLIEKSEKTK
ncbi:MAG: carboxypeptidase-like regulatory domain-containing protein [Bacteroidales bacterium]|jgi:hypothetical protein|nr:carboxypeptidase-like regulatory domain-containing protein [Bacteroidales bacterium]